MGPRLGSPVAGAYSSYKSRAHYWRTRRGFASITLAFFAIFFIFKSFNAPPSQIRRPVKSSFGSTSGSGVGSPRAAGSFGGWRGWKAPLRKGPELDLSNSPHAGEWSGPAAPLQSGLSDFDHPPVIKASDGDKALLNPNLYPTSREEEERNKASEEARRKKNEEEQRKKKKEEEERKKKEEEDRKKKEEEDRKKNEEEEEERKKQEQQKGQMTIGDTNKAEEERLAAERKQQEADKKKQEEEQRRKKEEAAKKQTDAMKDGSKDGEGKADDKKASGNGSGLTTTVVVGRLKDKPEEIAWIHDLLRDVTNIRVYIVDDPEAPLHLKRNKGRESMVYLRYIMDFYDNLDDVTVFYHSSRRAWHNNALFNRDAAVMINNLQRSWVVEQGYMNARCELYPGCPQWIKWNASATETRIHYERNSDLFSAELWNRLFPHRSRDPIFLSQPCCSQFAVSKDKIRSIPLEQYQRIHDWLGTTDTDDGFTGRIMEYTWQYLFLNKDEHCPDMQECYCKGYGFCFEGEHLEDLKIYNELRGEIDDTLDKLGKWNVNKGCPKFGDDEVARDACRADNPWNAPLAAIRSRKMTLEREMPKQWGIMEP